MKYYMFSSNPCNFMHPGLGVFVFLFIGSAPFFSITAERNHAYRVRIEMSSLFKLSLRKYVGFYSLTVDRVLCEPKQSYKRET